MLLLNLGILFGVVHRLVSRFPICRFVIALLRFGLIVGFCLDCHANWLVYTCKINLLLFIDL